MLVIDMTHMAPTTKLSAREFWIGIGAGSGMLAVLLVVLGVIRLIRKMRGRKFQGANRQQVQDKSGEKKKKKEKEGLTDIEKMECSSEEASRCDIVKSTSRCVLLHARNMTRAEGAGRWYEDFMDGNQVGNI